MALAGCLSWRLAAQHLQALNLADNSGMKVLDLQCQHHHRFEGWFASEDDFVQQTANGFLACPVCADKTIVKMLSAPRLNLGAAVPAVPSRPTTPAAGPVVAPDAEVQAAFMKAIRQVMASTENVGDRFAQEGVSSFSVQ